MAIARLAADARPQTIDSILQFLYGLELGCHALYVLTLNFVYAPDD